MAGAPSIAQNTTSAIAGQITDASGQPASGATVTIVHAESGSVSNVVTDAQGRYTARGLRPGGPYTITITKNGLTEKRNDVFINLAESASVDAQLGAPAVTTVTITGQAGGNSRFNSANMGAGTSISRTELAALSSIQRNLQDYARIDPRVAQTDKDRGEISVAGQNSRYNTITVDGVGITDTFGLAANGLPTAKQPISIDAIQSVQVNVSNYDVTQKGYTGANINAVTKSGTNNIHGSVYYVYRDDRFAGDRYNRTNDSYFAPPVFKETTKGVTVGGPIIKDKLFFFASFEDFVSTRDTPQFGPIGSALTPVGITQAAVAQANSIAAARYPGLLVGSLDATTAADLKIKDKLFKLDWNINDNHRANVRYSETKQRDPQFGTQNERTLTLSSQWYTTVNPVESIVAQVFSDWTENFSTEAKISRRKFGSVPENNAVSPSVTLAFTGALPSDAGPAVATGTRNLNFGTEFSRHRNILRTDTVDAYLAGNWIRGDHEIKFGVDYAANEVYNAFLQGINGSYTFGCIDPIAGQLTYAF
ncbi:MAG TPA: TonB-dependent receptor, partial [Burkholderiaceae bacterium]